LGWTQTSSCHGVLVMWRQKAGHVMHGMKATLMMMMMHELEHDCLSRVCRQYQGPPSMRHAAWLSRRRRTCLPLKLWHSSWTECGQGVCASTSCSKKNNITIIVGVIKHHLSNCTPGQASCAMTSQLLCNDFCLNCWCVKGRRFGPSASVANMFGWCDTQ